MGRFVQILVLGMFSALGLAQDDHARPLDPDPSIRIATLENELSCVISPEADSSGTVLISLEIQAGVLRETDEARGAAYLALRASIAAADRSASGKKLTTLDIRLGREINTAFGSSLVQITLRLPDDEETLRAAGEYLGEVLLGTGIESTIDRARAELLNELKAADNPARDARDTLVRRLAPDSRLSARIPLASREYVLALKKRDALEFHAQHYTPGNATVFIIGTENADRVLDALASVPGGAASEALPPEMLDYPTRPVVSIAEGIDSCTVGVVSLFQPPGGMRTTEGARSLVIGALAITVLEQRLEDASTSARSVLDDVGAAAGPIAAGIWAAQAGAHVEPADWRHAISEVAEQIRMLRDPESIAPYIDGARRVVADRMQRDMIDDGSPDRLLAWLRERWQRGDVMIGRSEFARLQASLLDEIDADMVAEKASAMFPDGGLAILAEGPPSAGITPDGVMNASRSSPAWTPEAPRIVGDSLGVEPLAFSAITELRHDPTTDVTTATLANGVVLRHRPMPDADAVVMVVRLDTRTHPSHRDNPALPHLASSAWVWPATHRHSAPTLSRWMRLRGITIDVEAVADSVSLVFRAPPTQALSVIELAVALCQRPVLSERAFERRAHQFEARVGSIMSSPSESVRRIMHNRSLPETARAHRAPTLSDIKAVTHDESAELTDHIARFAPMDVAMAGAIDRSVFLKAGGAMFGVLPGRAPMPDMDQPARLRTEGWTRIVLDDAAPGTAQVLVAIRGAVSGEPTDRAVYETLAAVLDARLLRVVADREVVARTLVSYRHHPAAPTLDTITISVLCRATDADSIIALVHETLQAAADEPISRSESEAAKARLIAVINEQLGEPRTWAEHIAQSRPRKVSLHANSDIADALLQTNASSLNRSLKASVEQGGWIVVRRPMPGDTPDTD